MKGSRLPMLLACIALSSGCATAVPAMSGGSTTPKHRTDLGLGGAARVPLGELKDWAPGEPDYQPDASAGGVVPMGYGRYGLSDRWDLGLLVAGTMARIDARYESLLKDGSTRSSLVVGIAPYGGWIADNDASAQGGRAGLEVPFTFGLDINGVYEMWLGARASGEWVRGDFVRTSPEALESGWGLRIGPVVGMALGIRRIHALVELTAQYEHWSIDNGTGGRLRRNGVALVPGFAIRLRL